MQIVSINKLRFFCYELRCNETNLGILDVQMQYAVCSCSRSVAVIGGLKGGEVGEQFCWSSSRSSCCSERRRWLTFSNCIFPVQSSFIVSCGLYESEPAKEQIFGCQQFTFFWVMLLSIEVVYFVYPTFILQVVFESQRQNFPFNVYSSWVKHHWHLLDYISVLIWSIKFNSLSFP
jgi:hypothetical protein